jgi:hypothetical protein
LSHTKLAVDVNLNDVHRELRRVDYSDGQIERAELKAGCTIVIFNDWQENTWRFEFGGVVLFRAYEFGDVAFVTAVDQCNAIEEAVSAIERDGGKREGYPGLLCAEFSGDMPMVTIVFQTLRITGPCDA